MDTDTLTMKITTQEFTLNEMRATSEMVVKELMDKMSTVPLPEIYNNLLINYPFNIVSSAFIQVLHNEINRIQKDSIQWCEDASKGSTVIGAPKDFKEMIERKNNNLVYAHIVGIFDDKELKFDS